MKNLAIIFGLLALSVSFNASASPAQNRYEHNANKSEQAQNRYERRDDKLDLVQLENLLRRFDQAKAARRPALMSDVDSDVLKALAAELVEGRQEVAQKYDEAARSGQELAQGRAEAGRDAAYMAPPPVVRDDVRDVRKDAADYREDRADLNREQNIQLRKRSLAREYRTFAHMHDPRSSMRKRAVLIDLITLAKMEVQENRKEKHEDRNERREDKQERHEDRRMGH
ncbi:MAG: hypothetical protein ACKO6N_06650 [Myxococcota bacterium]